MLTKSTPNTVQLNLFHSELFSQLDTKDPLIQLANTINWSVFDNAFEKYYCKDNGRPSKPIRLMVGLLILKQLEDLSDERVVLQFKRNASSILLPLKGVLKIVWLSQLHTRCTL